MPIPLPKLQQYFYIDKLIYHSVDLSLYMVSAIIDGKEQYITENSGDYLRAPNLIELQKQLQGIKAQKTVLRHSSPYDEMIGGPDKPNSNTLEVPLADNQLY